MLNKSRLFFFLAGFSLLLAANIAVFSQGAPVRGKVELLKPDNTREPVAGAVIEVFRTDVKGSIPSAKANKKGEFSFISLPYDGVFVMSVSAPNCAPTIYPNVKAGDETIVITLSPGDGKKWTEAEVRKAVAGAPKTTSPAGEKTVETRPEELTEEQKKAKAEYDEKVAKRDKTLKTNDVVARSLKEGNEAFTAKNYDLAVAKYDEGIAADPDFVGSSPVLNSNRAKTLLIQAIETYNASNKVEDATEKVAMRAKVKKGLADASEGYLRAWNLVKTPPAPDVMDRAVYDALKIGVLNGAVETFSKAVRTEQIDQSLIDNAKIIVPEYLNLETDPAKKHAASLALADLYRVNGDSENAIMAYSKMLETSPDDVDALAGAGFSLVNLGYVNNDKSKMQEGANLLQKFANLAPDTNKFKADALALIETLKKEQNVAPQKVATPARVAPKKKN